MSHIGPGVVRGTIREYLVLGLAGLVLSCAPEPVRRPNIILIVADDLGYEVVAANGGTSYATPNLDSLAADGMRFTHAYATPLCTPSRVQLLTGRYGFRNYIGFGLLDPSEKTLAHLLKDAGYRTGVVGKWQLYGNARQRALAGRGGSLPEEAGFDEHCLWQVRRRGSRFKDPMLEISGREPQVYIGEYGPDRFADCITSFLERDPDRPFFLFYPMVLTHDPFLPTPRGDAYYTGEASAVNGPAYFAENLSYLDELVGRIVRRLDELGMRENTLLLFTSDNGTSRDVTSRMNGRSIRGGKALTTDAGTHVPLIVSWPGVIEPGATNDNLVDFTDFVPTLLEAAGIGAPEGLLTDGVSFHPQLTGREHDVRSWIFCHYAPGWDGIRHRRYAQDRVWKLYGDGSFYHLPTDPFEELPIKSAELTREGLRARQHLRRVLDEMRNPRPRAELHRFRGAHPIPGAQPRKPSPSTVASVPSHP